MGWADAPVIGSTAKKAAWESAPIAAGGGSRVVAPEPQQEPEQLPRGTPDVGKLEAMAHLASGAVAAPVAGLAGIVSSLIPGVNASETVNNLADRFTYNPRTQAGKAVTGAVMAPFEWLSDKGNQAGEKVSDVTGSPALGATANTIVQSLPAIFGKVAPKIVKPLAGSAADYLQRGRAESRAAMSPEDIRRTEILRNAQDNGYTTLPVETNPSVINHLFESVGGKIKTAQNISEKNQPITNEIVKRDVGAAPDEILSKSTLGDIRTDEGANYQAVRNVGPIPIDTQYLADTGSLSSRSTNAAKGFPALANDETGSLVRGLQKDAEGNPLTHVDADHIVDQIGILREESNGLYKSNPSLAKAKKDAANALEGLVERYISNPENGFDPALVQGFREARTKIAKTYDVQGAVAPSGDVSTAAVVRRGRSRPLSGGVKDVAEFGGEQPKATQRPQAIGGVPAGSIFDAALTSIVHGLKGVLSLGVRPLARSIATSRPYQRAFVQPQDYLQPGMIERIARGLGGGEGSSAMPPSAPPDPHAIPFTKPDVPMMIAEQLGLSDGPKKFGNEIDFGDFLREIQLRRAIKPPPAP